MTLITRLYSVGLVVASVYSLAAQAQPAIDLGGFGPCRNCVLAPQLIATFGDTAGGGIIEKNHAEVRYSPGIRQYAVYHVGTSRILVFDTAGRFVRSFGRKGQGPGEITGLVDAQFSGPMLVVLDRAGPKLMVMSTTGEVRSEPRLSLRAGRFRVVSETSIVVGAMDRSAGLAGYPLHLVTIPTAVPVKHFGSTTGGQWSAAEPYAQDVALGYSSRQDAVLKAQRLRLEAEEWSVDDRLLRTITGDLPWFPRNSTRDRDGPPPTGLLNVGIDAEDRLWTVVQVPDEEWRNAPRQGRERLVLSEHMDKLFDVRIDGFDLRSRRHLGSVVWDEAHVGLTQIDGTLAVNRIVYDKNLVPRVALYRLGVPAR